jgi:hypothetical protein
MWLFFTQAFGFLGPARGIAVERFFGRPQAPLLSAGGQLSLQNP